MILSEYSVKYKVAGLMIYVSLAVLGIVALKKIPLEFLPKMEMPFVDVIVNYPGSSPAEICENIAEKIEEEISTMHGIKKIETHCREGNAEIGVQLNSDANSEYQALEVRERIERIKDQLPSDLPPIIVAKFDTDQFPIIFASVGMPPGVEHYSELLEPMIIRPLKTVEGVADVQFFGIEEKRVKVEIDQDLLNAYHINIIEVYGKLVANNLNMSLGSIEHLGKNYSVRIIGEFSRINEIRNLRLRDDLVLSDVAKVDIEYVRPIFRGRVNGKPAPLMLIQKEAGANTVQVSNQVMAKIQEITKDPQLKGAEVRVWFNQANEINRAVHSLKSSGLMGALLAFFVLWIFVKDFRATFIISLSIPASLLITLSLMYFMGYTFNVISMSGLVMGIGMLVDNAIVVMEAIYARFEKGHDRNQAAIHGTDEVGLAISASTTTTMIVFLPLIFSKHREVSVLMGQLGVVTVISIGSSLLVSLTLIPLLASLLITGKKDWRAKWFQRVEDKTIVWLEWFLTHRAKVLLPLAGVFALTLSFFFVPQIIEKESVPKAMMRILQIRLVFEQKPSDDELEQRISALEDIFLKHKDEWELDAVNYVIMPAFTRVSLVLREKPMPTITVDDLQEKAKALLEKEVHWPGVSFQFETMNMGGPEMGASPTTIKVKGDDPDQVYYFAEGIRKRLLGLPSIKDIGELEKEGQREVHVEIDRELAQKYGFDPSQVAFSVAYMFRGASVGKFTSADRQLDLYFQLKEADRKTLDQLQDTAIYNLEGKQIPLKNIATFRIKGIPEKVLRENRRFTVRIPVYPKVRDLGQVRDQALARLKDFHLPKGYIWVMGEEYQDMINMLYDLLESVLLATILVFIVMTAQFESFLLPFVIMFEIPLATIGVSLALTLTRSTFNILSGAGCLVLIGVVVNNAIVLISHVNNLRKQGLNDHDSLIQGSRDRMRPIAMTSLTTILGVLPLAIGLNDSTRMVYSPLAIAVMGGMIVSTFFTPLIIPVIYSLTDSIRDGLLQIQTYLRKA